MKKYIVLLTALVLLFLGYRFALNGNTSAPVVDRGASVQATDGGRRVIDGSSFSLNDYHGKVLVIDFWATWCGPCRRLMPVLHRFYDNLAEHDCVKVVAINVGEMRSKVERFAAQNSMPYDIILDQTREISTKYGVRAIPTIIVFDPNGKIIDRSQGYSPSLDSKLRTLLKDIVPQCFASR